MIEFPRLKLVAPSGSVIGVIGVLEGADGLKPGDAIPETPGNYILDQTLALLDPVAKAKAVSKVSELRRAGATIVLVSYDELLLEACADEIWWIRDNGEVVRGDPAEVLEKYRMYCAAALRAAGADTFARLSPTMRKGDGRAVLEQIELSSSVWQSGEPVFVAITVRFAARIEDPVIGIMIRTRIGLNVYGTNTELERLKLGPVEAADTLRVTYSFRCDLCPGQYTITAASHDPDGLWHDWLEDAVAFSVADSRYTAGVANLRATIEVSRSSHTTAH